MASLGSYLPILGRVIWCIGRPMEVVVALEIDRVRSKFAVRILSAEVLEWLMFVELLIVDAEPGYRCCAL